MPLSDTNRKLLLAWALQVRKQEATHRRMAEKYRKYRLMLGAPTAFLAGVSATNLLSTIRSCEDDLCINLRMASILCMVLSTGLSSCLTFFDFGGKCVKHDEASNRLTALFRLIDLTLTSEEIQNAPIEETLKNIQNQFNAIASTSPSLRGHGETLTFTIDVATMRLRNRDVLPKPDEPYSSYHTMNAVELNGVMELGRRDASAPLNYQLSRLNECAEP
uniref:VP11 n=1 Tax=viral metagenome TaxID=1070528 RepID=A0A6C0LYN0_9ZZZZ